MQVKKVTSGQYKLGPYTIYKAEGQTEWAIHETVLFDDLKDGWVITLNTKKDCIDWIINDKYSKLNEGL